MSRFADNDQYEEPPYQTYVEYSNLPLAQPPDSEYEYDDDAETEAFLAQQRSSRFKISMAGKLNPQPQSRMPKAEALNVVRKLKGTLIASSLVAFGLLSALVATHTVSASSQAPYTANPGSDAGTNSGTSSSSPSAGGNYFQHQSGGGYGFGNNNRSGFGQSPAVSGSQAS